MMVLYKDFVTNEFKQEKAVRITPCTFHLSVYFEDGRNEFLPFENVYDISVEKQNVK